jgi:glucoamylase
MQTFSKFLLLGSLASQSVLGSPASSLLKRDVSSFISTESPIALTQLLCNIGPNGCDASEADAGMVVAAPSMVNPDCK